MRNVFIPAAVMLLLFSSASASAPHLYRRVTSDATWTVSVNARAAQLTVTTEDGKETAGTLSQAMNDDVEIRELPDGSMVPASVYRGALGHCSASVDVGLANEGAWVSLYDCLPDTVIPGGWQAMLPLSPVIDAPALAQAAWIGAWRLTTGDTFADIEIADNGDGRLRVYGLATKQVSATSIHDAEFNALLVPQGNRMVHDAAAVDTSVDSRHACRIEFALSADVLAVDDNHRCGGRDASFDGSYRRLTP